MGKEKLENKNILFSVDNVLNDEILKLNIEKYLKNKFKNVYYIKDELDNKGIFFKILRETLGKFNKESIFYRVYKNIYRELILKDLKKFKKLDYFFVLSEGNFSRETILELKRLNKNIKTILFLWDKVELTDYKLKVELFDYIYSFDREDCKNYNLNFRGSFFIDECNSGLIDFNKRNIDLYYICSLRENERYNVVKKMHEYCKKNNLVSFLGIFLGSKEKKSLKNYDKELILDEKISYFDNLKKLKNSKVSLDLKYKNQNGLTLRCYEALATETKIITNNKDIKNYDFYNQENIKIINSEKDIKNINVDFFNSRYRQISDKIKYNYSVEGFLKEIFDLSDSKKNPNCIKIIKNDKRSRVIYDSLQKQYIKEFNPRFNKIAKNFLKLEKYPGYNFRCISNLLESLNIRTPKIINFSKYEVITNEIQGKSLEETLKKSSKEESKKYIEEYISLIRKLIENRIYFADYSCDNFYVYNGEIYALDLEDYRNDFLFYIRKKNMLKVMEEKIRTIPKECLEKLGINYSSVIEKILEKRRKNEFFK